ncbi:dihydroneopterin aldolase [Bacillus sp. HMF5848]|uniref:dihydroneopterin aldolase n=1 Tax=Bacillus sp. HMF5848 TaxID=2495421 RepID=UPI000F77C662|nr:dihydroneopterin aldolase [Bacillus sp. HMF5848]RSK25511.1 dihydroneopterin aldolase [Bacillus sp. HMF5848]
MDKIILNQLMFYGYHGVLQEETKIGQRFLVDIEIKADLKQAGQSDALEDTINYAEIYKLAQEIVEKEIYKLIEAVADRLAAVILEKYAMAMECTVKVVKPDPPIPGYYESVAVEVTRSR